MTSVSFLDDFDMSGLQICKLHRLKKLAEIKIKKGAMHKILPLDVVVVQRRWSSTTARAGRLCKNKVK